MDMWLRGRKKPITLTDQERDDLDLYAPPVGLFGLLNRTSTQGGARRLRDMLDHPLLSSEPITRRQRAVQWLSDHHDARIRMMASALPLRRASEALDRCVRHLEQTQANDRPLASTFIRIWSLFSGPTIAYWFMRLLLGDMRAFSFIGILVIVNGIIRWTFRSMLKHCWSSSVAYVPMACALRCLLGHADQVSSDLPREGILTVLKETMANLVRDALSPRSVSGWKWQRWHQATPGRCGVLRSARGRGHTQTHRAQS